MIANYYTLKALISEWQDYLVGRHLGDAFSQEPGELSLAFYAEDESVMVRIGTRAPFRFMFRVDGYSRARRNVATMFEGALDRRVTELSIADRDRIIYIKLEGGLIFQIVLFGPRANILLLSDSGLIQEAFQKNVALAGLEPPQPRAAPPVDTLSTFEERWRTDRPSVAHAVSTAFPLFDRTIAAEAAHRAGLNPEAKPKSDPELLHRLYDAARKIESEIAQPSPRIYWAGEDPEIFTLIAITHVPDLVEERFDTVDAAVRVFVRRSLARRRFKALYDPVEKGLREAAGHYRESAERMLTELSRESRADQYEKYGHLLMTAPGSVPAGADEVEIPDSFSQGEVVSIQLDPSLTAIQNAQRFYHRARRTRRARDEAEKRLVETERLANQAESLLRELESLSGIRDIEAFRSEHEDVLDRFMPGGDSAGDRIPFRRFKLPGGFEVWVGRNARQNDDLTFHHAQKYDLWMHARGAAGSHAVLRKPGRHAEPGRHIIQKAASIAAYFSKARGSDLVPVMVTERKYVRKPKGSAPGAVMVEREEVLLVEPALPD